MATLAEEKLLIFDPELAAWGWDLGRIRAKGYTDNVVVLMSEKLHRLSVRTQNTLQHFACLGHSTKVDTLALICGEGQDEIETSLAEAVEAGLILLSARSCIFVHDRVRDAAHALIPERMQSEIHLKIARILSAHTSEPGSAENIFGVVNHFNLGEAMIHGAEERNRVAALNLAAGRRARESTAYASARIYLAAGRALLSDDAWERHYALAFALEFLGAESEFLTGELAMAEERLLGLCRRTRNLPDRAAVTCLQMTVYIALDRSDRVIKVCFDYLRHIGTDWSVRPTEEEVHREYDQIWERLGDRSRRRTREPAGDCRRGPACHDRCPHDGAVGSAVLRCPISIASSSAAW